MSSCLLRALPEPPYAPCPCPAQELASSRVSHPDPELVRDTKKVGAVQAGEASSTPAQQPLLGLPDLMALC